MVQLAVLNRDSTLLFSRNYGSENQLTRLNFQDVMKTVYAVNKVAKSFQGGGAIQDMDPTTARKKRRLSRVPPITDHMAMNCIVHGTDLTRVSFLWDREGENFHIGKVA